MIETSLVPSLCHSSFCLTAVCKIKAGNCKIKAGKRRPGNEARLRLYCEMTALEWSCFCFPAGQERRHSRDSPRAQDGFPLEAILAAVANPHAAGHLRREHHEWVSLKCNHTSKLIIYYARTRQFRNFLSLAQFCWRRTVEEILSQSVISRNLPKSDW
jgi:hypothetical protein